MLSLGLGLIVFEVARRKRVEAVICQARIRNVAIVNRDQVTLVDSRHSVSVTCALVQALSVARTYLYSLPSSRVQQEVVNNIEAITIHTKDTTEPLF